MEPTKASISEKDPTEQGRDYSEEGLTTRRPPDKADGRTKGQTVEDRRGYGCALPGGQQKEAKHLWANERQDSHHLHGLPASKTSYFMK